MKKEYKIEALESGKLIIIYFLNDKEQTREHYADKDGEIVVEIRIGYTKHKDSL